MLDTKDRDKQLEYIKGLESPTNILDNLNTLRGKVDTFAKAVKAGNKSQGIVCPVRDITNVDAISLSTLNLINLYKPAEGEKEISPTDLVKAASVVVTKLIQDIDIFNNAHQPLEGDTKVLFDGIIEIVNGLAVATNTEGKVSKS